MKKTKQLKRNIVNFEGIDLSRVYYITEKNGLKSGANDIVKLCVDVFNKVSYSEDFESLTGLNVDDR
jgi:hypothetical protein